MKKIDIFRPFIFTMNPSKCIFEYYFWTHLYLMKSILCTICLYKHEFSTLKNPKFLNTYWNFFFPSACDMLIHYCIRNWDVWNCKISTPPKKINWLWSYVNNYSLDTLILTWYCWCAVIFNKLKFKCWGFYEVLDLEEEPSHPPSYALSLVDQVELVHKLVQVVRRLHHASQQRHQCNIISLSLSSSSLSSYYNYYCHY